MALESGMSVFTPFYQYSYTDLFQAHFNVEQVFCIHVIRAEDQMLAEPSFQFLHDDANQPFLLASRQLSQQSAECLPHQALVLARVSSCYVVQQTVHILDHQRAAVGTAWLQDEECCGSKVTGILIHTVRQLDEHSKNTHNSHFLVVSSTRWRPLLNVIKTCIFFTLDRPPTSGPVICGRKIIFKTGSSGAPRSVPTCVHAHMEWWTQVLLLMSKYRRSHAVSQW